MNSGKRFGPGERLRAETGKTIREGERASSPGIVVYFKANDHPKFAAVVGRKVGKSHVRNRLKRRAREVFRKNRSLLKDYGIAVIFKPQASEWTYREIEKVLCELWKEKDLLKNG